MKKIPVLLKFSYFLSIIKINKYKKMFEIFGDKEEQELH